MWLLCVNFLTLLVITNACEVSKTKISGSHAPSSFCSGDLLFEDNFDEFDFEKWQHEITLSGGGNWEFQYYDNNRTNSYTRDGTLFIRPSLTSDQFGEDFLTRGIIQVDGGTPAHRCTDASSWGCLRAGTPTNILSPIKSARIRTVQSFNFRYGRVEVRAKMPVGDWLWPAVGGVNGYIPDGASNPYPKPWSNLSPTAASDFWKAKDSWLPTWNLNKNNGENASLKVDYVRVWAL